MKGQVKIIKLKDGWYCYEVLSSSGEILLDSVAYSTKAALHVGISKIKSDSTKYYIKSINSNAFAVEAKSDSGVMLGRIVKPSNCTYENLMIEMQELKQILQDYE